MLREQRDHLTPIGWVVLLTCTAVTIVFMNTRTRFDFLTNATCVVTGGLGGINQSIAGWQLAVVFGTRCFSIALVRVKVYVTIT